MGKAILCVDDEKMIIVSLVNQLREHFGDKYMYETAMSAEEALSVIDELVDFGYNVILIISDWLMQGMNGDEFLIEVHKKYPSTINIMLTGQANPEAITNARENAALNAYIAKPWDRKFLMNKIDELLSNV